MRWCWWERPRGRSCCGRTRSARSGTFPGRIFPGTWCTRWPTTGARDEQRLWFSSFHWAFGTTLRASDDFGKSWSNPENHPIKFPEDTGQSLKQIWQITPGLDNDPDHLFCGVEPAALFESRDGGQSWSLVRGLWNHPHREKWTPGNGGMCMHTVVPDPSNPKRVLVAVSAAGVYRTDDGGKTWASKNKGLKAEFLPEGSQYPEFGQCVHKVDAASGASAAAFPAESRRLVPQRQRRRFLERTSVRACRRISAFRW